MFHQFIIIGPWNWVFFDWKEKLLGKTNSTCLNVITVLCSCATLLSTSVHNKVWSTLSANQSSYHECIINQCYDDSGILFLGWVCVWTPGGVLNRNLGRGVRPTQRNPDPVQDAKYVNFATLSKRKCCNFLPCSRLDQALPYSKHYKRHVSLYPDCRNVPI